MSGERQVKIRWTSGERLVNVRWTSIWAWLCWTWNFSKFHFLVRPCLNTSFSSKFHPTGLERNYFNSWFQTQTHIADLVQFIACEVERGGSSESGRVRKHSHNMRTSKKSVVFVFDQNCIYPSECKKVRGLFHVCANIKIVDVEVERVMCKTKMSSD